MRQERSLSFRSLRLPSRVARRRETPSRPPPSPLLPSSHIILLKMKIHSSHIIYTRYSISAFDQTQTPELVLQ